MILAKTKWPYMHIRAVNYAYISPLIPRFMLRFLHADLVYHVQGLSRLWMSALCKSLPPRTNKPGPINVNPYSRDQSMSFPLLQNQP